VKLLHCPRGTSVKIANSVITDHPCTDNEEEGSGAPEEEGSGAPEESKCEGFEISTQRFSDVLCNMKRSQICTFSILPYVYKVYGRKPCPQSKHYLHGSYSCQ